MDTDYSDETEEPEFTRRTSLTSNIIKTLINDVVMELEKYQQFNDDYQVI